MTRPITGVPVLVVGLLGAVCLQFGVMGTVNVTTTTRLATPSHPTVGITTSAPPFSNTVMPFSNTVMPTTATPTPATVVAAHVSTTPDSGVCANRIDTCSQYGHTPCTTNVYQAWAQHNCALYCGFCTPNITNLDPSQCRNKVPNCPEYDGGDLCTAATYYSWAYENCRSYCKFDKCNDTDCADQTGFDCATLDTALDLCADIQKAKLVCRKYCKLCKLIDGMWGTWASWGDCSVSCANGTQTRTRDCNNPPPSDGGLFCVGAGSEHKECTRPACPVNGNWASWSSWGTCSVPCDVGMQRRDRACSHPYPDRQGLHCFGTPIEYTICLPGACADGQWSEWEDWSNCTTECGGVRERQRNCSNPEPSALGKQCIGNSDETAACECAVPSFTATNLVAGPSSGTVRFSNVLFSQGSDYNSTTGVFTCSVPGVYHFTASLTKMSSTSVYAAHCYIRLNGSNKIHIDIQPKDTSNNGYGSYSASATAVLHLDDGDDVNLGSCTSASSFHSTASVFTGFLVKSD